jgi:hypothetical protein
VTLLETYTAGVQAARDAYNADEAVRDGRCSICGVRELDGRGGRYCTECRNERYKR